MDVLLIHGQGRTKNSMRLLGWRLLRRGYGVRYFGYTVRREPFVAITRRLAATIAENLAGRRYAIVGHSLGCIITRATLPKLSAHPPEHIVMLAPPNNPPRMARLLRDNPVYRRLTTDCGAKLASPDFYETLDFPAIPTTIIAGTGGPRGRWSPFGDEPNDGLVSVTETSLGAKHPVLLVPTIHTLIMNSPVVFEHIDRTLRG